MANLSFKNNRKNNNNKNNHKNKIHNSNPRNPSFLALLLFSYSMTSSCFAFAPIYPVLALLPSQQQQQQSQHLSSVCLSSSSHNTILSMSSSSMAEAMTLSTSGDLLGSMTIHMENYDIVKVDLDDGRDYPIHIDTGYSNEEVITIFNDKRGKYS